MPDPNKFEDKQDFMDACMHQVVTVEGKPQPQAVAQCMGVWESRSKKKKKKKKCASDILREASNRLLEV
jgi:hypothetical protein